MSWSPAYWLASFGGIGRAKYAPGTAASLVTVILWGLLEAVHPIPLVVHIPALIVAFFLGVVTATKVEEELGIADPSVVVWDEVVGQWTAVAAVPFSVNHALLAFALFRLLDIRKPGPIAWTEKLPRGWGIMVDDLVAGIVAGAIVYALFRYLGV